MKKEEEAIKKINSLIKTNKDFFENQGNMLIDKRDIQTIETVLNILKEKNTEIEKLKKDFKIVDEECNRLERKEAEQDKMIDEMTIKINEAYFKENDFWLWFERIFGIKSEGNYTEEIKQYFEKISKEEIKKIDYRNK